MLDGGRWKMEERECGRKKDGKNYREGWRRTSNTHAPLTTAMPESL